MAKEHPRYANMEWPEPEFSEFPKLIYPDDKTNPKIPVLRLKASQRGVMVHNAEEEAVIRGGGTIVREGDEKSELQNRLTLLGVQWDKRWGIGRLGEEIAKAEAALNE